MSGSDRYDVVCVGGGTAGMAAARAARYRGARVALVERDGRLGGECTYTGCVPSKTLLHAASVFWQARTGQRMGIHADGLRLDFGRLMAWKDEVIGDVARDEQADAFRDQGIDVLHGEVAIGGPDEVRVDGRVVRAGAIVIATGSAPVLPDIPGLGEARPLTNETVFSLTALPSRLLVVGGGPIGVELAQAFGRFGSEVTLVQRGAQLLAREEPELAGIVARVLGREGVDVRLGTEAARVERRAEGSLRVHLAGAAGAGWVDCDRILVAAGRRARTAGLDLERVGVRTDGRVLIDERCRTSVPSIYAAGDCASAYRFTHVAAHEGRVAGDNAAGHRAHVDYRAVPWVTFSDPELARVGLTEQQARDEHDAVEVVRVALSRVDRARCMGQTDGVIRVIVAGDGLVGSRLLGTTGGRVVGCHIVAPSGGELLAEATLAMHTKAFAGRIAQAIHAYPTMSMGLQQTVAQLFAAGRAQVDANEPA